MALIHCPECGKEVSSTAYTCIHCGYRLKEAMVESPKEKEDCISRFTKTKYQRDCNISLIIALILMVLIGIVVTLFVVELMPLLELKDIRKDNWKDVLEYLEELADKKKKLGSYQSIGLLIAFIVPFATNFCVHMQTLTTANWLKNECDNFEQSLEKALSKNYDIESAVNLKKEKLLINTLLNAKLNDKKSQILTIIVVSAYTLFSFFVTILAFSTLDIAYQQAIKDLEIVWKECISSPLVVISVFFLIVAIICDLCHNSKLKRARNNWVKQNLNSVYPTYKKYFG